MRYRFRSPHTHGFTLVELMVALSGGLFLSLTVFALSRDTSRFYQRENRLASATLAGMVGFERLKADIARAGYLSTPNILRDPFNCMPPVAGWPTQLASLSSLRINPDVPLNTTLNAAGLTPDELILGGSYTATDEFPIRTPQGNIVFLQAQTGPMARLGYLNPALSTADQTALLASVFGVGRSVRIVDHAGMEYFSTISAVAGGANPTITLGTPALVYRGVGASLCGLKGFETGGSLSVINFVRYQIRDLRADGISRFQPLFDESAGAPGEATRTELVRQELNANGQVIEIGTDLTTELVAEYAVDLGFSVSAQLPTTNTAVNVVPGDANFATVFNAAAANIGNPQGVRAVRVRLSVRSREADREAAITGGLYRFQLPDGVPGSDWARVRTFQADVALPNQADVRW